MSTVRDIATRALKRLRIVAADETPEAADLADTVTALSDMMYGWEQSGVNALLQADWSLADTFVWFVPPKDSGWDVIDKLAYQGTWDANANSPALASGSGTNGYVYKVATAGSTTLNDVTSWAVNDYAVFDGGTNESDVLTSGIWRKGIASRRFDGDVAALLAVRMAHEFGKEPGLSLQYNASDGWNRIAAACVKPPTRGIFDSAISRVPSNRYQDYVSS